MQRALFLSLLAGCLFAGLALPAAAAVNSGPDVTVYDLSDTTNYGVSAGIRGYSVGTTSCNMGDKPVNWCDNNGGCGNGTTNHDHPAIAQNMYRLKDGRFEQIGASWLKHGFTSLNQGGPGCGEGTCVSPPLGGNQLGVGCTDPYVSNLNGNRPLGRKSEVNPTTGSYPFPFGGGGATTAPWNQRVAVAESDMDATLNPGAVYYIEGQYVAPDDAVAGNGLNNAAYRRVTISAGSFNLVMAASTVRMKSAIEVWPTVDNTVEFLNLDTNSPASPVERFHVARKVTFVGGGIWHYEYAIHNMNSARAADGLTIEFGEATSFTNIGFHDVDAHSGEPYDGTDWVSSTTGNSISWDAAAFSPAQNANALRWATMYSFWFDADAPPAEIAEHDLSLFESGTPNELTFWVTEQETALFKDGFESGDAGAWGAKLGGRPGAGE